MPPHKENGAAGAKVPLRDMLDEYFTVKRWENVIPTKNKLEELEIEDCI